MILLMPKVEIEVMVDEIFEVEGKNQGDHDNKSDRSHLYYTRYKWKDHEPTTYRIPWEKFVKKEEQ